MYTNTPFRDMKHSTEILKCTGEAVHLECKAVQGRRNIWVKLVMWFKNSYTPTVLQGNGTWAMEPVNKRYLSTLKKFKRSLVIPAEVEERILCLVDRVEESARIILEEKRFHFSWRVIPAEYKEVTSTLDYCGQSLQKQIFSCTENYTREDKNQSSALVWTRK